MCLLQRSATPCRVTATKQAVCVFLTIVQAMCKECTQGSGQRGGNSAAADQSAAVQWRFCRLLPVTIAFYADEVLEFFLLTPPQSTAAAKLSVDGQDKEQVGRRMWAVTSIPLSRYHSPPPSTQVPCAAGQDKGWPCARLHWCASGPAHCSCAHTPTQRQPPTPPPAALQAPRSQPQSAAASPAATVTQRQRQLLPAWQVREAGSHTPHL